jgi:hypothetical protein
VFFVVNNRNHLRLSEEEGGEGREEQKEEERMIVDTVGCRK